MASAESDPRQTGDGAARRSIDEATKKAMALGRARSRVVDMYIKALETHKGRNPGQPKPDPNVVKADIKRLTDEIAAATGVAKLLLIQERADLDNQLKADAGEDEFKRLEEEFVTIAKQFSLDRKISYESWREIGVPVRTLNRAHMYPPNAKPGTTKPSDS